MATREEKVRRMLGSTPRSEPTQPMGFDMAEPLTFIENILERMNYYSEKYGFVPPPPQLPKLGIFAPIERKDQRDEEIQRLKDQNHELETQVRDLRYKLDFLLEERREKEGKKQPGGYIPVGATGF